MKYALASTFRIMFASGFLPRAVAAMQGIQQATARNRRSALEALETARKERLTANEALKESLRVIGRPG